MNRHGGPVLPDDEQWETEANEARHKALDSVRATAKEWGTSISLILGAFTTAAFLKGPEALTDVPANGFTLTALDAITYEPALVVLWSIILGGLVLAFAVAAAALAAQGTPGWTEQLTGQVYAIKSMDATKSAIRWLLASRVATALAATLILGAMAIAWTAQAEKATPAASMSAIVSVGGGALCGILATNPDGSISITPDGGGPQPLAAATVTIVDSCP